MKFDRMARRLLIASIIFWLCSIYTAVVSRKLFAIPIANIVNHYRFVPLTFWFKTFVRKFFVYFICICLICDWITFIFMRYSKNKVGTIYMLYILKNCQIIPLAPHNSLLSQGPTRATFFCPQGGRCGEVLTYCTPRHQDWSILL